MTCNGFKGGIGTASRVLSSAEGGYTVGVLVQCNYGRRNQLRIAGIPWSSAPGWEDPPICYEGEPPANAGAPKCGSSALPPREEELGSIIIVVATDAPVLPHQLKRLVKRAALGIGRMGGIGGNGSGDIFIAFSTANPGVDKESGVAPVGMLANEAMNPIFQATIQATEESILNAMVAARDMVGANGLRVPALPHDRVRALLKAHGW
jgi:L-aminopeptidase/D-esterase-like protein